MMQFQRWRTPAVVLACVAVLVPTPTITNAEVLPSDGPDHAAPSQPEPARRTIDVALDSAGTLRGKLMDSSGNAETGVPVVVVQQGHIAGRTVADAQGNFAVRGLRGGTCQIIAGQAVCLTRVWAHGSAPPSASRTALVIADGTVIRGQGCGRGCGHGCGKLKCLLHNPWVLAAGIGAAIAIPIAAHDDDNSAS